MKIDIERCSDGSAQNRTENGVGTVASGTVSGGWSPLHGASAGISDPSYQSLVGRDGCVTLGRCNDGDLEIDGEIKWIVLAEENGKKLIVSENILAHKKYHQTLKGITWEASDLREWLNTIFYAKFFTEQEQRLLFLVRL